MQKKVFIAILFFSVFSIGELSAQVTCSVRAPQQVAVGQAFQLSFILNGQASKLPALNFSNFSVVAGPTQSSSTSMSIVNGQVSSTSSFTYTYTLVASKEGTHTLPALTFVVNNQNVKSDAFAIQVVAASQNTQQQQQSQQSQQQRSQSGTAVQGFNKEDFFVKATVSNANPYVGEQVIVNYKLYIGPQAYRYQGNVSTIPSSQGFWTYDLTDKKVPPKRYEEVINGKRYVVEDLRAIAAYPQKSGKLTITPLNVDLIVQVPVQQQRQQSNDPFDIFFNDPFFGGTRLQNIELKLSSNAVTVTAHETPSDRKPIDYSGLVGNFTITSKLSRDKLSTNDATNLNITISGSGNLQYIDKLNIEFPSDIDAQEPSIKDNIKASLTGISGSRTFEYILIPRAAGKFTIPAAFFSYFDKGKNSYVTLSTTKTEIMVEKGKDGASSYTRTSNKKDLQVMGTDIRHIKTNIPLNLAEKPFFLSLSYWIGLLLPIFLLIVIILLLRKRIENQKNRAAVRDKRASKLARKRLHKAEKLLKNKQDTDFYVEISQALWGYVCDKFRIPLGQLSLDTASQKLKERNMEEASIDEFLETLNQCEQVRFAPSSEITPEKMYERTFNFITKIERELKK